jgi:hypothetical protein
MAGEFEHGGSGGSPFSGVDSKLTMYALANGMDLAKDEGSRRLAWYRDGMDRGILVALVSSGDLEVTAMAWSGDLDGAQRQKVGDALAPDDLTAKLSTVLDGAIEAANAL